MSESPSHAHSPDEELDLRGVICPYNFVKTKLKLESMAPGQLLLVHLDDGDPIRNVPRSVSDDGHHGLGARSARRHSLEAMVGNCTLNLAEAGTQYGVFGIFP